MQFRQIAIAASLALCGSVALAAPFGEVPVVVSGSPTPTNNFVIASAADGTVSATYKGTAIDTVLMLSGASASAKTIGAFVISDNCDATKLSVIHDVNGATVGGSYRAYACDVKAGNVMGITGSLLVIKRDAGGSAQGVLPIATPAAIGFMNLQGCSAVSPLPTAGLNTPNYTCPVANVSNYYPDAGFSDVEPTIISASINGGTGSLNVTGSLTTRAIFQQIIGVAVNLKLYRALQDTQGIVPPAGDEDSPLYRPTLSSTFVRSAVTGKLTGSASATPGKRGWGLVVDELKYPDVHKKQINVCRRSAGSGTQAAAFIKFQDNPCTSVDGAFSNSTALAITGTTSALSTNGNTAAVETCLKSVDELVGTGSPVVNDGYAIGHIGRDNDPKAGGTDKKYRFVKLDGAQPEAHPDLPTGKCSYLGCDDAQNGTYNYVFESTMQWNSATPGNTAKAALLNTIATAGFTGTQLQGNDPAVIAGVMALPTSYAGTFGQLSATDVGRIYGSRVTRNGNSCVPAFLVK